MTSGVRGFPVSRGGQGNLDGECRWVTKEFQPREERERKGKSQTPFPQPLTSKSVDWDYCVSVRIYSRVCRRYSTWFVIDYICETRLWHYVLCEYIYTYIYYFILSYIYMYLYFLLYNINLEKIGTIGIYHFPSISKFIFQMNLHLQLRVTRIIREQLFGFWNCRKRYMINSCWDERCTCRVYSLWKRRRTHRTHGESSRRLCESGMPVFALHVVTLYVHDSNTDRCTVTMTRKLPGHR